MENRSFTFVFTATLILVVGVAASALAQISASTKYERGQSIQPVYEGWEQNPDGTYSMWFGYLNRNFEERITVPVGPQNNFQPGNADRGQPTIFETADKRRQAFAFKVDLPADWPKDRDLTWTLTANGVTLTAIGSLWPVWLVSDDTIATNRGAQRIYDPRSTNKRPVVTEQAKGGTVGVGVPLTLTLGVTDDGQPRRRAPGELVPGGAGRGPVVADGTLPSLREALKVSWLQWRGPGKASFNPAEVRVLEADGKYSGLGSKATTTVTFDTPGTYLLRAYVQDMSLMTIPQDITVVVEKK
jgi:hypothetical protein